MAAEHEKDVLFQKLGDRWYAFTEINQEVVYCALPPGVDPQSQKFELYSEWEAQLKKTKAKGTKGKLNRSSST